LLRTSSRPSAKANVLLALPEPMEDLAEDCLTKSLTLSRSQGALALELRGSIDLARRLAAEGQPERAKALLRPVFGRFAESSGTSDLRIAESLLASLSGRLPPAAAGRPHPVALVGSGPARRR